MTIIAIILQSQSFDVAEFFTLLGASTCTVIALVLIQQTVQDSQGGPALALMNVQFVIHIVLDLTAF